MLIFILMTNCFCYNEWAYGKRPFLEDVSEGVGLMAILASFPVGWCSWVEGHLLQYSPVDSDHYCLTTVMVYKMQCVIL